jgi:hypothetical protein
LLASYATPCQVELLLLLPLPLPLLLLCCQNQHVSRENLSKECCTVLAARKDVLHYMPLQSGSAYRLLTH